MMMAARVGARNAAELATLKVGGQLEGLRGISLDPFALLVAPRVLAWWSRASRLLAAPAFLVAILFESVAACFTLDLPVRVFLRRTSSHDEAGGVCGGLLKSFAFALAIALVSTAWGCGRRAARGRWGGRRLRRWSGAPRSIFALDFAVLHPARTEAAAGLWGAA